MNKTLKMTPGYLNSYGQRQRDLRTNPLYDESAWRYASTQGELQQYSYLLEGAKDVLSAGVLERPKPQSAMMPLTAAKS